MPDGKTVSREEILLARRTPLADFLLERYPKEYEVSGHSVVNTRRRSFSVAFGIAGYYDFQTGVHGNPIDFLMKYKGFDFQSAVCTLCRFQDSSFRQMGYVGSKAFSVPVPAKYSASNLYRYLTSRAVPNDMVNRLIREKLIYEDVSHNVVFINKERDYYEVYGTKSMDYFRCAKINENRFWYLPCTNKCLVTYVCLTALDALSLALLKNKDGISDSAVYISSAGQDIQHVIDRVSPKMRTVLALGNDEHGDICRERNPGLVSIRPAGISWNDDLRRATTQWR